MIRATVIAAINSYFASNYAGPVVMHSETSVEGLVPPYAVIRIGSGEQMFPGVAEIWDLNILVGVFQDADTTLAGDAESTASAVFGVLGDPDPLYTASAASIVWSNFERIGTEASIVETRWQHVAVFRAIVAPVE